MKTERASPIGPEADGLLVLDFFMGGLAAALGLTGTHPWGQIVLLAALLLSLPIIRRVRQWNSATWGALAGLVLVLALAALVLYVPPILIPIEDVLGLSWLIGLVAGFNMAAEEQSKIPRWLLLMIAGVVAWVAAWPFLLIVGIGGLSALRVVTLAALAKCILAALGGLIGGLLRIAPARLWRRRKKAQLPKAASDGTAPSTTGLSRREMLRGLAGVAGLVLATGGSLAWLFSTRRIIYRGHTSGVNAIAWSPDGQRVASASSDKTVQVLDAATGMRDLTVHSPSVMTTVAWSPDGKRIVSGNIGKVQVWDAATGSHVITLNNDFAVDHVAWSPDGQRIAATGDEAAGVLVWDANTGAPLLTYSGHNDPEYLIVVIFALAWSPDGKRLASGDENGLLHVWDATTGQTLATYTGHTYPNQTYPVTSLAWSQDGRQIASASWDGTVQVWDANSGAAILTYRGHTGQHDAENGYLGWVNAVSWSPVGNQIASGGEDKTVKVWDATSGSTNFTYFGHSEAVDAVAWSPDGSHVASGGIDKTVQVWQAA